MIKTIERYINNTPIRKKILMMLLMGIILPIGLIITVFSYQITKEMKIREENHLMNGLRSIEVKLTDTIFNKRINH